MKLLFASPTAPLPLRPSRARLSLRARRPPRARTAALIGSDYYRTHEGLNDANADADMRVWNSVIYGSLKRKLHGPIAPGSDSPTPAVTDGDSPPVTAGISALIHSTSGFEGSTDVPSEEPSVVTSTPPTYVPAPTLSPENIVEVVLQSLAHDARTGARLLIRFASVSNHVRRTTPDSFVLFVSDTDIYRDLLHIRAFDCKPAKFAQAGDQCVIAVTVHSSFGKAIDFGFQLSVDEHACWLVDEVFRI